MGFGGCNVAFVLIVFASIAVLCGTADPRDTLFATSDVTKLAVPQTLRTNFDLYRDYYVTVDTATAPGNQYSSFSIQVHTQLYTAVLTNFSSDCQMTGDYECTTTGSNVGLVQVWNVDTTDFLFRVRVECGPWNCSSNSSVRVLLATVGIPTEAPIPGGCALTSNLLIDPNIVVNYTTFSTVVRFLDSDVGFRPSDQSYPTCDASTGSSSSYPLTYLEYTVYQRCLGRGQFSVSAMMDAIEDMLTASLTLKQESSYATLQYNKAKRVMFASTPGQGVVYNVIATDKRNNQRVAYVPAITYACDVRSPGGCRNEISPFGGVIGIVLIFAGLFLCLVGHLFFHGEVAVLHWISGCFFFYLIISIATTSVDHNLLLGLSLLCGSVYCLVWFLFWFLTGWHWVHVVVFGLYADFIIISAILYSPLEDTSVFTVLQISYVYCLTLFCGMVLFMVPIVAFPRALSIWASSLVGSYVVISGIGMFVYSELTQIVLLVVRKLSISGFYSAHVDCPLLTTDYILMALWIVLLVVGVTVQTTVVQIRRTKHNRRQQTAANNRRSRMKFSSFPRPSLLRKLLRYSNRNWKLLRYSNRNCSAEAEPLLTPGHLSRHGPWSSHSNGESSPSDSGRYPSNYGAMGATTVNDPAVLIVKK